MWIFENYSNRGKGGTTITKDESADRLGNLAHEALRGFYLRAVSIGHGWLYYNSKGELVGKLYKS